MYMTRQFFTDTVYNDVKHDTIEAAVQYAIGAKDHTMEVYDNNEKFIGNAKQFIGNAKRNAIMRTHSPECNIVLDYPLCNIISPCTCR